MILSSLKKCTFWKKQKLKIHVATHLLYCSLFLPDGTHITDAFKSNSSQVSLMTANSLRSSISLNLFVITVWVSDNADFSQLSTVAESIIISTSSRPHFTAKIKPFKTDSNSAILIWLPSSCFRNQAPSSTTAPSTSKVHQMARELASHHTLPILDLIVHLPLTGSWE